MRSGVVECLESSWLQPSQEHRYVSYGPLESGIVERLKGTLALFDRLEVGPPFAVFVSLLNVRGHTIPTQALERTYDGPKAIRLDNLYLPEVLISDVSVDLHKAMKPAFDAVWNACGIAGSRNYDAAGEWSPRQYY